MVLEGIVVSCDRIETKNGSFYAVGVKEFFDAQEDPVRKVVCESSKKVGEKVSLNVFAYAQLYQPEKGSAKAMLKLKEIKK